jgi:DNA-binding transcriptional LysR family regulator
MDRLDAIQMFVRAAESGSFSAVARERGVGQPAVSKQIAALEAHLGAQLMQRTSRTLTLTEAGQDFYDSAVRLVGDLEAAEAQVGHRQISPSGLVRASVAPVFGRLYVVPKLQAFFARYPDIDIELLVSDRSVNLVEEGVDVAIHNGELSDSALIGRKIAATPIITVASPAYLAKHGEPARPSELDRHEGVIFVWQGAPRAWGFHARSGAINHAPQGHFRTNDAEQIRAAVLGGLGLAHTPGWLFAREIAAGSVRRIMRDYEPADLSISAVRPGGRRLATKVRVFIDFLAEIFAAEPSLAIARRAEGSETSHR